MLVKFAVDPAALDTRNIEHSLAVALHRRVIESWREVGIFVHAGARLKESPFLEHVDKLPVALKSLWINALKANKRVACPIDWDGDFGNTPDSQLDVLARIDLALLESAKVTCYTDIDDGEHGVCVPALGNVELCRFHSVEQSIRLNQARTTQNTSLLKNSNNADEWGKRYSAWLRICDNVVVVDRYGVQDYLRSFHNGEKPGLTRMLDTVYARGKEAPANVTLFVGDPKVTGDISTFIAELRKFCGDGIREIALFLVDDRVFREHGHHRYMRCDYAVFGIDRGIGAFSGILAQANCVLWRRDRATDSVFEKTETALRLNGSKYQL
ncbi:hypothetical protein [Paraburkholderia sp. J76]|uniref:hypothetical protein n=1 Tax=Paraburkholderia sp. J76 TaxID=2805439 RepID=UPI002ABD8DCB|nr:hypothetical protein [Paraburkholderia sp. J76]